MFHHRSTRQPISGSEIKKLRVITNFFRSETSGVWAGWKRQNHKRWLVQTPKVTKTYFSLFPWKPIRFALRWFLIQIGLRLTETYAGTSGTQLVRCNLLLRESERWDHHVVNCSVYNVMLVHVDESDRWRNGAKWTNISSLASTYYLRTFTCMCIY